MLPLMFTIGGYRLCNNHLVVTSVHRAASACWVKADREVVLAAVAQDGLALRHASAGLRADWEVVLGAVPQNRFALEHASAGLKADREFILAE